MTICDVCPVKVQAEVWRPLPIPTKHRWGHQYAVSSLGRVCNVNTGRMLKPRTHNTGYLAVTIGNRTAGNPGTVLVHTLVALAFLGPPPKDGYAWEVDHLDFDRLSAWVHNLRWLRKDTNAWRWKFWSDEEPPDWAEPEPMTPDEFAAWCARIRANGWPDPPLPKPWDTHRHLATA